MNDFGGDLRYGRQEDARKDPDLCKLLARLDCQSFLQNYRVTLAIGLKNFGPKSLRTVRHQLKRWLDTVLTSWLMRRCRLRLHVSDIDKLPCIGQS